MGDKIEKSLSMLDADKWYVHLIAQHSGLRVVDVISYIAQPKSGYKLDNNYKTPLGWIKLPDSNAKITRRR